jgi:hypothetical protein
MMSRAVRLQSGTSGHCSDALLKALEAELGVAQLVPCFMSLLTALGRGRRRQVSFKFSDARTHLPRLILTQRLYPAPPAHLSSRNTPKTCGLYASKTLTSCKREHSKFNEC